MPAAPTQDHGQDDFTEILGEGGLISQSLSGYEHRPGQIKMAAEVLTAFEQKRHLIVEAGTGTGKTLAYLVPAIAYALDKKQRVIISTGTKNLQEQLMEKDIPFLLDILPGKFKAAYMKGRANYACLYRIKKAEDQPILTGMADLDYFAEIGDWVKNTETGDRAELSDLPENLSFWPQINAKGDTCLGQKCPDFNECFVTKMRQRASEADIVIVNHHLFFADLGVRQTEFGAVLPDYSAVIFDEAHLLEDIASDYFGFQVSNFQIDELVRDTQNLPITDIALNRDLSNLCARLVNFADQFWVRFTQGRGQDGRFALPPESFATVSKTGEVTPTALGETYFHVDNALERIETALDVAAKNSPEIESVVRRTRQARFDLDFIAKQSEKNYVYWFERRGRGTFLCASPIDVSVLLQERLFEKVETAVLTSATLSSSGKFDFLKKRLGLTGPNTSTLLAPSGFDYQNQTVLYLPDPLPDPRHEDYTAAAANEIVNILNATNGRAFVLSTSISGMTALYEAVSRRVDFQCFLQGTASKAGILEKFKTTPNAVLFATSSFWQGVDVRGEQLSCVIIDRLPFAVPTDPLVAARTRYIDENGGKSFMEYSVPQAIINLKQGIGRLIRSKTDKGVIAILDPRIRTKFYGRDFINSLPKCKITSNLSDIGHIIN